MKKVDFRFEFAAKVKEYLDDEKDEKIIKDGHRDIIFHYLYALEAEIGVVKNPNFTFFTSGRRSHIVLENIEFKTEVNVKSNIIEITRIVDNVVIPLDTIVAKDRELFALGRNEKFNVQILEQYLFETFGEKLGL
ncbi:hypothetical protein CN558_16460 [Bacillus wiedmannii]|uniref:DUF3942 domain-containing protein n=1 Tax=Bacillus wiedmannii TaxID=1890302 RepID=A0A2B6UJI9_9BACI|nr:hypothetical protein CN690_05235 [Bacillus wiedmannii]PEM84658.1 hypothetical protein CN627_22050 [Bacillus wiedmannii]PEO84840.1 hypothetical protein CN558_16460 [Bacillus wiedmannii]PGD65722.1 hypothetical protein COM41_04920 [Bacillus wiedmannii]PHG65131.1 hypothetical protein COI65_05115 [Bacillus wiedmannii]